MAYQKKLKPLKGLSLEEQNKVQAALDKLCAKHGLRSWGIGAKKSDNWRKLVLTLCGFPLEQKRVGRPIAKSKASMQEIYESVTLHNEFIDLRAFDKRMESRGITDPERIAQHYSLELEKRADTMKTIYQAVGKFYGLKEAQVRGRYQRYINRVLPEGKTQLQLDIEERNTQRWPSYSKSRKKRTKR